MWNGKKLEWFLPSRGIRQGDAISPYLFVLCMELLNHVISNVVESRTWKPIQLSKIRPNLSHLFFADDLILFAEAWMGQIKAVMKCLEIFCSMSSQKVSLHKSSIFFSKNVAKEVAEDIVKIAGILLTKDLGRYLGFPSLHGRIEQVHFQQLLDRLNSKT